MRCRSSGEADTGADERVDPEDPADRRARLPGDEHDREGEGHGSEADDVGDARAGAGDDAPGELAADRRHDGRREHDCSGGEGVVAEHVLGELLPDEHRADERAEGDRAGEEGDPEGACLGQRYDDERARGSGLAPEEADEREHGNGDAGEERWGEALICFLDGKDEPADAEHREDAADVVDRELLLARVPGQDDDADDEGEDVEGERDKEDRSPPVVLEHPPADERADSCDASADAGPQGDRLHLGAAAEERADEGQGGREEERCRQAAEEPAQCEELGVRRPGRHHRGRDGEDAAEDEHELSAIAIADRTQIQDG